MPASRQPVHRALPKRPVDAASRGPILCPAVVGRAPVIAFVHRTRKVWGSGRAGRLLVSLFRFSRSPEPIMPLAASQISAGHDVIATLDDAVSAVESLFADARRAVGERVTIEGRTVSRVFDREQRATHGLAWLATYVEALRQLAAYAQRMAEIGQLRRDRGTAGAHRRRRISRADHGRHSDEPGRDRAAVRSRARAGAVAARITPAVEHLIATGNTAQRRARLVELMRQHHDATVGACGLDDTLDSIREEMRKFAEDRVVPVAQAMASEEQLHSARRHCADVGARRVQPHHP